MLVYQRVTHGYIWHIGPVTPSIQSGKWACNPSKRRKATPAHPSLIIIIHNKWQNMGKSAIDQLMNRHSPLFYKTWEIIN